MTIKGRSQKDIVASASFSLGALALGEGQLPGHVDPQAAHGAAGLVRNQGLLPRGLCVLLGKFSNLRMTVASTALTVVCSLYFNCICNKILPNKTEITLIKNNSNQNKIRNAKSKLEVSTANMFQDFKRKIPVFILFPVLKLVKKLY